MPRLVVLVTLCLTALAGCSTAPPSPSPAPSRSHSAPDQPLDPPLDPLRPERIEVAGTPGAFVRGKVIHLPSGERIRVRLATCRPWSVAAVTRNLGGFIVADTCVFEGTLGIHRLDAQGRVLGSWISTGPALPGPGGPHGPAAWVSVTPPESGLTIPARVHIGGRSQEIHATERVSIISFDGTTVVYETPVRRASGKWVVRRFATDLSSPPTRLSVSG
ncbi:MAG: hypothetical protein WAW88_09605 [Nocardioides sp.]